jgi:hypothetical protein
LLAKNPKWDLKIYVVWGTVLPQDTDPPTDSVAALITDPRVKPYWDPNHEVNHMVRAAADSGMAEFSLFKEGGHTPYDMANLYTPGTKWIAKIPEPVYVGTPVGTSIDEIKKQIEIVLGAPAH